VVGVRRERLVEVEAHEVQQVALEVGDLDGDVPGDGVELAEELHGLVDVLEDVHEEGDVEDLVGPGDQLARVTDAELDVGGVGVPAGPGDGVGIAIDADDATRTIRQPPCPPTIAASNVEHAPAVGNGGGDGVTVECRRAPVEEVVAIDIGRELEGEPVREARQPAEGGQRAAPAKGSDRRPVEPVGDRSQRIATVGPRELEAVGSRLVLHGEDATDDP